MSRGHKVAAEEYREEIAVIAAAWAEYAAGGFTGGAEEYAQFAGFLERCQKLPWWQEAIDRLKRRGQWNF
jgi:hypothetical protein